MPYSPYKGACLSIPFNNVPHLFVVMNGPCKDGNCLLVMVSTIKPDQRYDDTCVLNAGDHAYINRPSYLVYRSAETMRAAHITKMVGLKYYEERDDMESKVFQRIVEGLFASEDTRGRIINYATSVGL